jgi:hypothetical protein
MLILWRATTVSKLLFQSSHNLSPLKAGTKIKSCDGEILNHDVLDEIVTEKIRFSSNPGTIGTQIIKKCLSKVIRRLLEDINRVIESDIKRGMIE